MAGKRVAVLSPEGQFGTVDEKDVEGVTKAGGRVLTKAQVIERELEEKYDSSSTASKIAGALTGVGARAPQLEAWHRGAVGGLTAGLGGAGIKKAADAIAPGAGKMYADEGDKLKEAFAGTHAAGEVAGMIGGAAIGGAAGLGSAGIAARAIPGAGISALGGAAEAATGRAVAGVAARGVLGRAAATAAELGVRGAIEGGAYAGSQYAGDAILHDHELAADKFFASVGTGALYGGAGGALGGAAGSLLASGAKAAGRGALGVMGRAMAKGEGVALKVEEAAVEAGSQAAPVARGLLEDLGSVEGQKGLAYDQAWRAVGAGQGLQTTRYAGKAAKYLPNGTRDVGEVLMRKGIINAEEGAISALKNGTPAAIAPRIAAELETVGTRIGEITAASPARIDVAKIAQAVDNVAAPLEKTAAFRSVGAQVRAFGTDLRDVMGLQGPGDSVTIQALLDQRKALDKLVYTEAKALDPKGRVGALRELRSEIESVITDALDEASGKVPGAAREEYKALKKDYLALSIASEAAEDSATRMAKNRALSPTDYATAIGAAAGGHLMAAPIAAIGHKLARERGNAAAAVMIYNAAERGTLTKAVERMDNLLGKASKGLLTPPIKGALPAALATPAGRPQERAHAAMKKVAEVQSDPEGFADKVARSTEAMSGHSPEIANAVGQRMVGAFTFLATKMPAGSDPDPLDPHPAPHMTDAVAAEFARYSWYAEKPERFFTEVAHGKLTFEGAETAKALMPRAFAELQQRTADALATQMARGRALPFQQRLVLGQLLDFAAVPSQRLDHMQMLQKNAAAAPEEGKAPKRGGGGGGMGTQKSALDRLEANGPGRR